MAEIAVAPESTAAQEAERWLAAFETALADGAAAAAAALFATDSYWRDLVAVTFVNKSDFSGRALLALVGPRSEPTRPYSRANSSTQAACRTQKVARFEFGDESLSQLARCDEALPVADWCSNPAPVVNPRSSSRERSHPLRLGQHPGPRPLGG